MDHEKINKTAIETNDKLKFVNFNHAKLERIRLHDLTEQTM